jgi:hypothetical protein
MVTDVLAEPIYHIIQHYTPENCDHYIHCHENLGSYANIAISHEQRGYTPEKDFSQ